MTDTSKWHPSSTPQDEIALDDESSFVDECMARIADDVERFGWRLGKSIVTRSNEWGLVWRVDLLETPSLGRIRRIICWRPPGSDGTGLAIVYVDAAQRL
jgi:hypothetical protein